VQTRTGKRAQPTLPELPSLQYANQTCSVEITRTIANARAKEHS
jgi:hypothetical protein